MLRRTRSSEHHLHHNSWLYDLLIRGHQDWKDKKEANRWQPIYYCYLETIQTRWVRYQTAAHTSSRQIPPKKSCKYRTWSQFLWHFHYNSYSRMRPSQYLLILTEKNIHTENQKQETSVTNVSARPTNTTFSDPLTLYVTREMQMQQAREPVNDQTLPPALKVSTSKRNLYSWGYADETHLDLCCCGSLSKKQLRTRVILPSRRTNNHGCDVKMNSVQKEPVDRLNCRCFLLLCLKSGLENVILRYQYGKNNTNVYFMPHYNSIYSERIYPTGSRKSHLNEGRWGPWKNACECFEKWSFT